MRVCFFCDLHKEKMLIPICNNRNNAVLWYLTPIMAHIIHHAALRGAYAHRDALSLTGNPSEAKWQIPQQGVEKEICHAV